MRLRSCACINLSGRESGRETTNYFAFNNKIQRAWSWLNDSGEEMLKSLINLANHLDQKGLIKEADALDLIIESNIKKESGWLRDYAKHSALNLGQVLRHLRYLTDLPDTPRNKAIKQRLRWIANDLYYTVTPGQWHHTQDELDELSGFTYADLLRMGFDPDFADKIKKKTSPE